MFKLHIPIDPNNEILMHSKEMTELRKKLLKAFTEKEPNISHGHEFDKIIDFLTYVFRDDNQEDLFTNFTYSMTPNKESLQWYAKKTQAYTVLSMDFNQDVTKYIAKHIPKEIPIANEIYLDIPYKIKIAAILTAERVSKYSTDSNEIECYTTLSIEADYYNYKINCNQFLQRDTLHKPFLFEGKYNNVGALLSFCVTKYTDEFGRGFRKYMDFSNIIKQVTRQSKYVVEDTIANAYGEITDVAFSRMLPSNTNRLHGVKIYYQSELKNWITKQHFLDPLTPDSAFMNYYSHFKNALSLYNKLNPQDYLHKGVHVIPVKLYKDLKYDTCIKDIQILSSPLPAVLYQITSPEKVRDITKRLIRATYKLDTDYQKNEGNTFLREFVFYNDLNFANSESRWG